MTKWQSLQRLVDYAGQSLVKAILERISPPGSTFHSEREKVNKIYRGER